ncbi:MAG: AMP-binding protein, partial [Firmicutes bacterium]|nr:AMP-binding protein [Bacillota bacterium]
LEQIIVVTDARGRGVRKGDLSFWEEISRVPDRFAAVPLSLEDPLAIQYTSGATGLPKGAVWSHRLALVIWPYMKYALDLQPEDMFWGAADPGWAYGLIVCVCQPLLFGNSIILYEPLFTPEGCYRAMEKYRVTNFTYAPTAYRALMAAGDELRRRFDINLRVASSAGEPLNPEVIEWFRRNFGIPIYDHYGLTECGMLINNYHAADMTVKSGSMGLPTPGFEVALVDDQGNPVPRGQLGQIALNMRDRRSVWFLGYYQDPEKTAERRRGDWFLSGDVAVQDEDGYFWFQGRDDDIITSAGYRIGPFEIESTLIEHPAVAEAAVV